MARSSLLGVPSPKRRSAVASRSKLSSMSREEDSDGEIFVADDKQPSSDSSDEYAATKTKRRKVGGKKEHLVKVRHGSGSIGHMTNGISSSKVKIAPLPKSILNLGPTHGSPAMPPARKHGLEYHRPLLLSTNAPDEQQLELGKDAREALLKWFDKVSESRNMPWRKEWIDPTIYSGNNEVKERESLKRRAYEVWISEIMLQQTRVATVIDYWNRWMERWPTIEDLAKAKPDEVTSAWRGLGYYSRATRIHTAAQQVVNSPKLQGLLPATADELEKDVPGVGRYTAGAISSIVFGIAAPMLDGNVSRVLSRQLGLYADSKGSKSVIDSLWMVAEALVHAVANDAQSKKSEQGTPKEPIRSNRPGRWGQALMELGSTVCTPKPSCRVCPISSTCRAYGEGEALALSLGKMTKSHSVHRHTQASSTADVEDLCRLCEPLETAEMPEAIPSGKKGSDSANLIPTDAKQSTGKSVKKDFGKQMSLSAFSFTRKAQESSATSMADKDEQDTASSTTGQLPSSDAFDVIENHAKRFPLRIPKKAVKEEENIVCAIRRRKGDRDEWLIERRPEKGLLAGLWEMPSLPLSSSEGQDCWGESSKAKGKRRQLVKTFAQRLVGVKEELKQVGEIGSVPWVFSHLKLTMHVHYFELISGEEDGELVSSRRWASTADVESENMGTGMRRCWAIVKACN